MSILEIAWIACATLWNTVVQSDVNLTLEWVNMNVSSLLLKNKEKKVLKAINEKYNESLLRLCDDLNLNNGVLVHEIIIAESFKGICEDIINRDSDYLWVEASHRLRNHTYEGYDLLSKYTSRFSGA